MATVAALGVTVGCGGEPHAGERGPTAGPSAPAEVVGGSQPDLVPEGYAGRYVVTTLVRQVGEGEPHLCPSAMAQPYPPPPCRGPVVTGWDWSAVGSTLDLTVRSSVTVRLVGTLDGDSFALTEPATVVDDTKAAPAVPSSFSTPCPQPPGGWAPVDAARTTEETESAVFALAEASPRYGGAWVDQAWATVPNDPASVVVNVTTTGDTTALEASLRQVWGGALCVSPAKRAMADLLAAQQATTDLEGFSSSGPNVVTGQLDVTVRVATVAAQRRLDERFGPGVVHLVGELVPVDVAP